MIALLFDKTFWISFLICIAIAAVVIIFALKPKSRPWISALVCIVLIGTSIPCVVNLNRYYGAQGGIKGVLSTIINGENKGDIQDNVISLKNVMLTLDDDGNYSATIIPENKLTLDKDKTYSVAVNGSPCGYDETSPDYVLAKYTYNFYDKDKNFKTDTLEMYFTMDNYTKVEVLTRGGAEMVKSWNYYFNRNNFDITINEVEENFSYEMPADAVSLTDNELINKIIKNNNLTLLKTLPQVQIQNSNIDLRAFDTRDNMKLVANKVDANIIGNAKNFTLLLKDESGIDTLICTNFNKQELVGKYREGKDTSSGATTGDIVLKPFNYYKYTFEFTSKRNYITIEMDYNPEFDANSWTPYDSTPTASTYDSTSTVGVPCNYIDIKGSIAIEEGQLNSYLTQGRIQSSKTLEINQEVTIEVGGTASISVEGIGKNDIFGLTIKELVFNLKNGQTHYLYSNSESTTLEPRTDGLAWEKIVMGEPLDLGDIQVSCTCENDNTLTFEFTGGETLLELISNIKLQISKIEIFK